MRYAQSAHDECLYDFTGFTLGLERTCRSWAPRRRQKLRGIVNQHVKYFHYIGIYMLHIQKTEIITYYQEHPFFETLKTIVQDVEDWSWTAIEARSAAFHEGLRQACRGGSPLVVPGGEDRVSERQQ